MTFRVIFVQVPRDRQGDEVVHWVTIDGYTAIMSLHAFETGKRKGASAEDKRRGIDVCSWSDTHAFYQYKDVAWARHAADYADTPTVEHEDIWSFYRAIGFDHKNRRYAVKETV